MIPEKLIVVGDFNIHYENILNQKNDSDTQEFLSILNAFGLAQNVENTTHIRGGIIDFVITHSDDNEKISNISLLKEQCSSDHFPIQFTMDIQPFTKKDKFTYETRNWDNVDMEQFIMYLGQNSDLLYPESSLSLEECVSLFNDILIDAANMFCPLTQKTFEKYTFMFTSGLTMGYFFLNETKDKLNANTKNTEINIQDLKW